MKKPQIARRIARSAGLSAAEAADRLDLIVNEIVDKLRHGKEAEIPGLGRFHPASDGRIRFIQEEE
jgi:nucleoid DNA-binding protein